METLHFTIDANVALITLDRPKALNALSAQSIEELRSALDSLLTADVRAIIITGVGDKAFVAGADIKSFPHMDRAAAREFTQNGHALMNRIANADVPIIAAVNGFALGGGCELALACHIRIAAESARFGQPEVKLGIIAGFGGTQRLPRLVGPAAALELLTTARMIDATEALRIGLVNQVVPDADLLTACRRIAEEIAGVGSAAVAATLRAVREGADLALQEALELEAQLFSETFETAEMREGVSAFLEKRSPDFSDTGKKPN